MVATEAVELDLDRVMVRRPIIGELHAGGDSSIRLRRTPVISVTSVTEDGVLLGATDWLLHAEPRLGIVYRGTSNVWGRYSYGRSSVSVNYVAGYVSPPRIARKVALNGVQRMWQTSQQASHPLLDEGTADEAVAAAVGVLTPLEMAAYNTLRGPAIT
jgi:hypothetical protein